MRAPFQVAGSVVACAALLLACSSNDEHAPPASGDCTGRCTVDFSPGSNSTGGTSGGNGNLDAGITDAGGDGRAFDASGVLGGGVAVFDDALFTRTVAFSGTGTVTLYGTGRVTAPFTDGTFSVTGVEPRQDLWALLQRTTTTLDVLPTFQRVDGTLPTGELRFFRASVIAEIFVGLTQPTTVDPNLAQIVLRFATTQGAPVTGVQVQQKPASSIVAYDTDSSYSDSFTATNNRGIALIVNAPAQPLPGTDTEITYASGTKLGAKLVRIAQGAVTLVDVVP